MAGSGWLSPSGQLHLRFNWAPFYAPCQVLERGQQVTEVGGRRSKWRLVRVAVVALSGSTYIGRLFFGDSDTDEVVWDCDARPSDGASLRTNCKLAWPPQDQLAALHAPHNLTRHSGI